jgi:hypothetical protein
MEPLWNAFHTALMESATLWKVDIRVLSTTAVEWAALASSENQRANRLKVLIRFARFARAGDSGHEIPPDNIFCSQCDRRNVLPTDQLAQLREICNQAKYRHIVWREWQFDRNSEDFGPISGVAESPHCRKFFKNRRMQKNPVRVFAPLWEFNQRAWSPTAKLHYLSER